MTLKDKREAAVKAMRELVDGAKSEERGFTVDEAQKFDGLDAEVKSYDSALKAAALADSVFERDDAGEEQGIAKSFGEAFVKSAGYGMVAKGQYGSRTEVKAATDIHTLTELGALGETHKDLGILPPARLRSIFEWLVPQKISEGAIKWVEETLDEGQYEIVAEGGLKPQLHFGYEAKSDTLHTAAGWFDMTTQMVRRAPQFAAAINRRGVRRLVIDQERLALGATAAADGFNGILNTSGIGTLVADAGDDMFETLYAAIEQSEDVGDFPVDGIVMNRKDWGKLVQAQNTNGDYYAGGPFAGAAAQRVWSTPVILSPSIAEGTALVGASENIDIFTEPTVHVDVTNSDGDKFRRNIVTTRVEQDMLAVTYRPAGLTKVTFAAE